MSNLPLGAENDPLAPYNEVDNPEIKFTLQLSQTINCTKTLKSSNYKLSDGDVDYQYTDFVEMFTDSFYTPMSLLNAYRKLATRTIEYIEKHCPNAPTLKGYKRDLYALNQSFEDFKDIETIVEPY